jgi:hypothetical protein
MPSEPEGRLVTLSRPIGAGDVVYAATGGLDPSGTKVVTEGSVNVSAFVPCVPLVDPVVDPPAPPAPPAPTPIAALTDGEVKFFVKTSAGKAAAALRKRTTPTNVTFAVPEGGTLTLRLSSRGRTLAHGTSKLPGAARAAVSLKRTVAGRRLLAQHGKPLRLTLTATFAPARAGAKAQRASVTVTRKG